MDKAGLPQGGGKTGGALAPKAAGVESDYMRKYKNGEKTNKRQ